MTGQVGSAERLLELHATENPLLLPNPWDQLLASLGFRALATTSGGFAASLGRLDGNVSREEAVAHAGAIAAATGLPVNGDFENCFADDPADAADTDRLALEAGIAGCSIEGWSGSQIYDVEFAAAGVSRVSVGSPFAFAAYAALVDAATELRDAGTYRYLERAGPGWEAARPAFAEVTGTTWSPAAAQRAGSD